MSRNKEKAIRGQKNPLITPTDLTDDDLRKFVDYTQRVVGKNVKTGQELTGEVLNKVNVPFQGNSIFDVGAATQLGELAFQHGAEAGYMIEVLTQFSKATTLEEYAGLMDHTAKVLSGQPGTMSSIEQNNPWSRTWTPRRKIVEAVKPYVGEEHMRAYYLDGIVKLAEVSSSAIGFIKRTKGVLAEAFLNDEKIATNFKRAQGVAIESKRKLTEGQEEVDALHARMAQREAESPDRHYILDGAVATDLEALAAATKKRLSAKVESGDALSVAIGIHDSIIPAHKNAEVITDAILGQQKILVVTMRAYFKLMELYSDDVAAALHGLGQSYAENAAEMLRMLEGQKPALQILKTNGTS